MVMDPKLDVVLKKDGHGVIRVGGSQVTLDSVVYSFLEGCSAETIADQFPTLPLAEIYGVIAYYLKNTQEVDAYLREQKALADSIQEHWEQKFPPQGVRARLLARRAASA